MARFELNLQVLQKVQQDKFLKADTKLMIFVKSTTKDENLLHYICKNLSISGNREDVFVELVLKEQLKLRSNGEKLKACKCFIPALNQEARSINHAATLISENFEITRVSHTKDAFREAYFQSNDGAWKSLGKWRDEIMPSYRDSKNIRKITNRLNKTIYEPNDFNKILDLINISKQIAQAIVNLNSEEGEDRDAKIQKVLNGLVGIDKLKTILNIWKKNQNNSLEEFWQNLLKENSLVLSQIFSTPVTILFPKAYVGGKGIENAGGSVVDFLIVNKLTRNTLLVEIKTPASRLLAGEYRNEIYPPSSDLSGAVAQISANKDSLIKEYDRLANESREHFEIFNPLCVVISGNLENELSDNNKRKSFEIYRSEHRNVQIITYDEVFEKIRTLIEILEGKD